MKKDVLAEFWQKYDLSKDDFFKHQHYTILTRSGIEKVQAYENILITYDLEKCEKDFAVVKAFASKGDAKIQTYGSALKGDFKHGNTNTWYVVEMAEKRAFSRAVLKTTGLYKYGVFGEDESESFKKKEVNEYTLEELKKLYDKKGAIIGLKQAESIVRIINDKEQKSYKKAINFLKSVK